MKRRLMVFAALLLMALTAACGKTQPPEPPAPPVQEEIEPPPEPTAEDLAAQEVQEILDSLTLEEKVGQLFFVRCPAENALADIGTYHLGGYVLFGRDFADKTADDVIQTLRRYQNAAAEDSGTLC